LLESLPVFTSQPSAAWLLQLAKPASQMPSRHAVGLPPQKTEAFGTGQQTDNAWSQGAPVPVGTHPPGIVVVVVVVVVVVGATGAQMSFGLVGVTVRVPN